MIHPTYVEIAGQLAAHLDHAYDQLEAYEDREHAAVVASDIARARQLLGELLTAAALQHLTAGARA
jgi:hypothetical protein